LNAKTVGFVLIAVVACRVTRARSEYTVTFLIADDRAFASGPLATGNALAGPPEEPAAKEVHLAKRKAEAGEVAAAGARSNTIFTAIRNDLSQSARYLAACGEKGFAQPFQHPIK